MSTPMLISVRVEWCNLRVCIVQEAENLYSGETLAKCPRCGGPSRADPVQERGQCATHTCRFDFCLLCLMSYHSARQCGPMAPSTAASPDCNIGSRKSRRQLRRLWATHRVASFSGNLVVKSRWIQRRSGTFAGKSHGICLVGENWYCFPRVSMLALKFQTHSRSDRIVFGRSWEVWIELQPIKHPVEKDLRLRANAGKFAVGRRTCYFYISLYAQIVDPGVELWKEKALNCVELCLCNSSYYVVDYFT